MSRLVDIGECRLEVISSGTTSPTVVFESGAGRPAADWDKVRSFMDPSVRTVAYSRAGQGQSDPPAAESVIFDNGHIQVASAESRTDDLSMLLEVLGVGPPYVLVGHSLGGIYIRLFAAQYPGVIAGLVFVDSSHPEQNSRLNEAVRRADLTEELREEFLQREPSPNEPVMQAAAGTGPFNGIPMAVFSQDPNLQANRADSVFPPELQSVWSSEWSKMQSDIANLSDDSSHTIVDGADHMVHHHAPEPIAAAIMVMVETTRRG